MSAQERRSKLRSFLEHLRKEHNWEFDRNEFDDRFLLQKYVFFAERMGFDLPYRYNIYVFGAYSPSLAQDYYSEDIDKISSGNLIPVDFDQAAFEEVVNRDSRWLEIASTLVLHHERFQDMSPAERSEKALSKTRQEKDATEKTVQQIYNTLSEFGLLEGP